MDRTKIPKPSQLRPPQVVAIDTLKPPGVVTENKQFLPQRTVLEQIPEHKLNTQKSTIGTLKKMPPSFPRPLLRRRSKSVSDLRSIMRPKTILPEQKKVGSTRQPPARVAAAPKNQAKSTATSSRAPKRNADRDSNEDTKPKVPKVKIPDWDYKSRFNFLNEKHSLLQQSYKDTKQKLSDLANVEEKLASLQEESTNLKIQVQSLTKSEVNMLEELKSSNSLVHDLKYKLTTSTHQMENLTSDFEKLTTKYELLLENSKSVMQERTQLQNNLDSLKQSHEILTKEHEKLVSAHNLMRLEFDTTAKDNEVLEKQLSDALMKVERLESETTRQKSKIISNEVLRREMHNIIQDLKGNIRVFCRVRPPVTVDELDRLQCLITYNDECSIEIKKCKESISMISGKPLDCKLDFNFDHVFVPESTQEDVFSELAQLVQSALDGYHICVFAYGQTGSGKTYTMQGEAENLGMIPKSIDLIFDSIEKLKATGWNYTVEASFLEIYNEVINDLLEPNSKYTYEIKFNEGKGTTVTNLKIEAVSSADHLKHLVREALQNRAVASTDFNEHSSRSHAVTKIYLNGVNKESNVCYCGSVNLVDLAGSESAKTSSTERLTETKNINKSLSALGSVMLALHNKDPHVPYRNSKLTYLLQSCLGGNSKTLMFVNISPFEDCYNETVNSLRFASKVKEVKIGSKRNKNYLTFSQNTLTNIKPC